ncbi:glycerol kinase GlpK [Sediminicola luteus]|uniref:Glycerol kinase n=1 Tax=Sediminicola luteus TaxID=319238 RepID=A0A2A4G1U6_9FLAO|nr:glycerol kinase GlpK [Sediminicola luteus]PCE62949.1 glycerol kinase [Sediminicola luteus]
MQDQKYILALDQGTTSSRALLVNASGEIIGMAQKEFKQIFPQTGWVEHDPLEILDSQLMVLEKVVRQAGIAPEQIAGLGITNQRETTVIWNKHTGKPIYNALVWQDTRTTDICEALIEKGLEAYVKKTTGLVIDAYFSGTKILWLLDHIPGAREQAEAGELLFGTIDSWLLWHLTDRQVHATDMTNASRTLLYDINQLCWDEYLLETLNIPAAILPQVHPSVHPFGHFKLQGHTIPITGIAGDQQAALFGQACFKKGMAKNTYGTGCFMLMNTGKKPQFSTNGLLTTIAYGVDGKVTYALEGSVFVAGAAIQWLRDGLELIQSAEETHALAASLPEDNPVYVVPAFAGLGAPYWDMYARGAIFGLTRDTGKAHLAKATLESLAYQTKDILMAMSEDSGIKPKKLRVDGGACANDYLMQFQAHILNIVVERPKVVESTAMGAAYMAGIGCGLWQFSDIKDNQPLDRSFLPGYDKERRKKLYKKWKNAIKRTKKWEKD